MSKYKRVYISGPMTDPKTDEVSAENLLLFWKAEDLLRDHGYDDVVNPVRVWTCKFPWLYRLFGYRLTLLYDLWLLMRCTHIYKLPRWQQSRGANIESCVAYHFKIWPVRQKVIDAINKKLEKIIKKNENQNQNKNSMDKLTKDFIKFEGVLLVILVVLICLLFASCTKTEYITVEKVRNDTVWQNHTKHDSIWVHDSIHVTDKGDTVRIEKWHTKYVESIRHDTVYKARTDSVPVPYPVIKEVERPRSKFEKGLMGVGILSIMALIVFIAFKLKRFLP